MSWISFKPLITWMIALLHPFFVSVIDIQHNPKEATLEISVRAFTDDLEKMILKESNIVIDLSDPKQKTRANQLVEQYIQRKIALNSNGAKLKLDFIGFEIQSESTWSYFEVKNMKQLKQLGINCELLFGINPQQINIIHVSSNGVRKSYELAAPKNSTQFIF
ncbi:MAG: hypothetical protein RL387_1416 [Bacteroidota bacterium]|jgi:hypothetical protein